MRINIADIGYRGIHHLVDEAINRIAGGIILILDGRAWRKHFYWRYLLEVVLPVIEVQNLSKVYGDRFAVQLDIPVHQHRAHPLRPDILAISINQLFSQPAVNDLVIRRIVLQP